MITDNLLSRLDGVKNTGAGRWIAKCPAHADKSPSLSIKETETGMVLMHCFAGCSCDEIAGAIGLDLSDLFPPSDDKMNHNQRREFFAAADVLRCIAFESGIVAATVAKLHQTNEITKDERTRLMEAWARISNSLDYAGIRT